MLFARDIDRPDARLSSDSAFARCLALGLPPNARLMAISGVDMIYAALPEALRACTFTSPYTRYTPPSSGAARVFRRLV